VLVLALVPTRPKRLTSCSDRPDVYPDEAILVAAIITALWQLSSRQMVNRLKRWPALAQGCGYQPWQVINASQLYRPRDRLGLLVYFLTFCALVWQLSQRGIILERDLVIDSTTVLAFSHKDVEAAWSYAKKFGYKIHMIICRDTLLPLMFLVTPANRNDVPWAVPLLALVKWFFHPPVRVVRADAAYFTNGIVAFILFVPHAQPITDLGPRRASKKFMVTLGWVTWWRKQRSKRGYIERFFVLLKRYYGLTDFQVMGLAKVPNPKFANCSANLLLSLSMVAMTFFHHLSLLQISRRQSIPIITASLLRPAYSRSGAGRRMRPCLSSSHFDPASNIRLRKRTSLLASESFDISSTLAFHTAGGYAEIQPSNPLVTKTPSANSARSSAGMVNRPFSSTVYSYSPESNVHSHFLPLFPTIIHSIHISIPFVNRIWAYLPNFKV